MVKKNFKNSIFSKVLKLFIYGMGCFGTDLGMFFHLYKGLFVIHEVFEKIEKKEQKVGVTRLFSKDLLTCVRFLSPP